jgi:hypothetical protein
VEGVRKWLKIALLVIPMTTIEVRAVRVCALRFSGSPTELVASIARDCSKYGVKHTGDQLAGRVHGFGLKASYEIRGDILTVSIDALPFLCSWKKVQRIIAEKAPEYGACMIGEE